MKSETYTVAPNGPAVPHANSPEQLLDAASNSKSRASTADRPGAGNVGTHPDGTLDSVERAGKSEPVKGDSLGARPRVARAAHAAANTLTHTAEYIRKHDAASMMADAKRLVKDNPGFALLGAAIVGFAVARIWSRD